MSGMCSKMLKTREATRQRDPLTVPMIVALEKLLAQNAADGKHDAVVAASVLFAVYSRTRVGDLRKCREEPKIDMSPDGKKGYIDTRFADHKTAKPGSTKALPIAAPAYGLTDECWAEHFALVRKIAKTTAEDGSGLVPALGEDGVLKVAFTTQEFTLALRTLLQRLGFSAAQVGNIGSHSLKATVLSWTGKFGIARDHRRLLGYHAMPGDHSVDLYAREVLAGPLREMERMLEAIRNKSFDPDATRSGLLLEPARPISTSCSSASSCSTSVNLDSDDEYDVNLDSDAVKDDDGNAGGDTDQNTVILNVATGMHHLRADGKLLACGKEYPLECQALRVVKPGGRICRRCF